MKTINLYELTLDELKALLKQLKKRTKAYNTVCMFIDDLEGADLH